MRNGSNVLSAGAGTSSRAMMGITSELALPARHGMVRREDSRGWHAASNELSGLRDDLTKSFTSLRANQKCRHLSPRDGTSPSRASESSRTGVLSGLPLLRLQRSRLTCNNFAGLGIEDRHYLMIPMVERTWLRPPVQLFQPLSHRIPMRFVNITTFTVWAVESQEGQQGAFHVQNPPRESRSISYEFRLDKGL